MKRELKHKQGYTMKPIFVASDVIGDFSRGLAQAVFNS